MFALKHVFFEARSQLCMLDLSVLVTQFRSKAQTGGKRVLLLLQSLQELKPKTFIGVATQFDGTNPNTKPKIGFAFDLKN